jgi:hypothetical protein
MTRAASTAAIGIALTATLFAATNAGGIPGAAAALLAMFVATLTVGLVVFTISETTGGAATMLRSSAPERCGTCGGRRELQREVHICAVCDATAAA